jgi:GNAT superfamily N-acetyltransferase
MIVRAATPADWPHIWPVFRAITAAGDTFAYPSDLTEHQARDLWMPAAGVHTAVAVDEEEGGAVLGTANMYANRPGNGAHVASASYMVDPARSGRGVGRALVEYSLQWAREAGFRAIQFNAVVETNVYAVRLYENLGFKIIGTVPEAFHHPTEGFVGLHVMHRFL